MLNEKMNSVTLPDIYGGNRSIPNEDHNRPQVIFVWGSW